MTNPLTISSKNCIFYRLILPSSGGEVNSGSIFRTALPLFALLLSTGLFAQVKEAFTKKQIPSVEVLTLDGKKIDVSEFGKNGKITVIMFWATWCAPCKLELSNVQDLYEDWVKDYNVEVLAISVDDSRNTAKVKSYVNGQGWDFTVLLDPNQDLQRAFNFQMPPYTVLIDQEGTIVHSHLGYKNGDEFILEDKIKGLAK